ncbi:MAG: aconitate hydratase AcnA [Candidatus Korobacteraceae bacterium]|jgi:aconitate hydratase
MKNSFGSRSVLRVGNREFEIYRLDSLEKQGLKMARLPYSLRILLENLLRREDGESVTAEMIRSLASYSTTKVPTEEIAFMPSRVLLQDLTGVPAIVDLAAMRDAMKALGGNASRINPLQPVELVIDHSVQVDEFGTPEAFKLNAETEYSRNRARYAFLRWGQKAFENLAIVPPDTGICHQINLEFLARVVFAAKGDGGKQVAYPDTVVGADSHTTMINGLGVLGWGVGGIEAEAAMLGQPISMLIPQVVGVRLSGQLPEGSTATDLVLTITQMLRKKGVVGKFVEYFGPGLPNLPLADRAVIANMSPEYGSTCGIFPVDEETLRYLRLSGRSDDQVKLVESYCKEQGLFHTATTAEAEYSDVVSLDLATVEPSIAGPKRPQDRVPLSRAAVAFREALPALVKPGTVLPPASEKGADGHGLRHGSVVIAAITSCTNTSNPALLMAAGLVAKKAVERGLKVPSWVKTSLAPGSLVVTEYLKKAGLTPYLDKLRFNLVGYGCTTCIGNSGPLPKEVSDAIGKEDLVVAAVLSGNRNFEGRIHSEVRANYLMAPPLVVAFALAGHADWDVQKEPVGRGSDGKPVYLKDIWPTQKEVDDAMKSVSAQMFRETYSEVFKGTAQWQALPVPEGNTYAWDAASTYVQNPPYFEGMKLALPEITDIKGARVLAVLGDSITTDHISPAGSIKADSPAGQYLIAKGVQKADFNSYGARRGNHQVMMRGTFANTRLKNKLIPQKEGPFTRHLPDGKETTIFEAAEQYRREKVPVVILAGKEYGSGSSRDWAAKGPLLLGVRAVIVESFERIHRSNLIGMGILPLQFPAGKSPETLGLSGEESFEITGVKPLIDNFKPGRHLKVKATGKNGAVVEFEALLRIDTPQEAQYYRHGGILQYVIRQLLQAKEKPATAR